MLKEKLLSEDSFVSIIMTVIVCGTISYCTKCIKESVQFATIQKIDPELLKILKKNPDNYKD